MIEKLRDARKDLLTLTLLAALASLCLSAWIAENCRIMKTRAAMLSAAAVIFALLMALLLWSIAKEQKHTPAFRFPLDVIMLTFSVTLFSYFILLLALRFSESEDMAEFIFKGALFFLSYLGFWCYRSTEKKQYFLYAVIYGLSVLASWVLESNAVLIFCSEIMSDITNSAFPPKAVIITIRDFAVPIREAMLLLTIWDNYPRKQDRGSNQQRDMPKAHPAHCDDSTKKRKPRKNWLGDYMAMKEKRLVDLLLILTGGAIALVSCFYLEGDSRWCLVALGCGMILIFLILAIREKPSIPLEAGAPLLDMPPAAKVTEVVLLNEEDQTLAAWPLYGKVSMAIGRDVGENHVDINLSPSAYASTVDVEHAVLNYTGGSWYVEDLGSKNGVSVQSCKDGRKYKLASDQPCKLEAGDIVCIGLARLLIR